MQKLLLFLSFFLVFSQSFTQNLARSIDSLLAIKDKKPFNGVILIAKNNRPVYYKKIGYSDLENKTPLKDGDSFVMGSVSKQITAAMILQEVEKGKINLQHTLHHYWPDLTQKWADSVTIHHLLTHTDGIKDWDSPLYFSPGTSYRYNQINFEILANVLQKVKNQPFPNLCRALFSDLGMRHSYHPKSGPRPYQYLVKGYFEKEDGTFQEEIASYNNNSIAAGGLITNAKDLLKWNKALHSGKILKDKTYQQMVSKQKGAVRQHPLFGVTEYGYGITVDTKENLLQLGQTGYSKGFASMNFYFPKTKTSLIILENVMKSPDDLPKTFYYHVAIWEILRANLK